VDTPKVDTVQSVKINIPVGGQPTASTATTTDTVATKIEEMPPQGPQKEPIAMDLVQLKNFLWVLYFDLQRFWIH
jgi:hypothetical protein